MKRLLVVAVGCLVAAGAGFALGSSGKIILLSVIEFLVLFVALTAIVAVARRLGPTSVSPDPIIIGCAAVLPVIYVSWSTAA